MKFTTSVPIKDGEPKIDHSSKILLLGSCFVENIGKKLERYQFETLINPIGILYHPKAIETFIEKVCTNYRYTEDDIFFSDEQWRCFDAHTCMNSNSKSELLENLNSSLQATRQFLKKATHIVLTFGTSWHYKHLDSDKSVANCHKISQKNFRKELLLVSEILEVFNNVKQRLSTLNGSLNLIFTVSPVRHLRDGFIENQQSKAHLITAIHQFLSLEKASKNLTFSYFPAYEIMLDELRDYRFYSEDMLHPNILAVDYIWERFTTAWIRNKATELFKEIDVIHNGLAHRAFNENSEKHQKFLKILELKIAQLKLKLPHSSL